MGAQRLAAVAIALVVAAIAALTWVATRDHDPAPSRADDDGATDDGQATAGPVPSSPSGSSTGGAPSTASSVTAPPPTSPDGVPVDAGIVVDARLDHRLGTWIVEIAHPPEMPSGTETLAIRVGDRVITGGAYVPGAVSSPGVDGLVDDDRTVTLSLVAETADGEPIAESEPVTIGRFRPPVDPDIVVDARLTTTQGVRFLEIVHPAEAPDGTGFWEVRVDGRVHAASTAVAGATLGTRLDDLEPGSTIVVTLLARTEGMRPIAVSTPVELVVDAAARGG
ncbi:MAG: hypothetical protein S0880_23435 [Actinomycetota bacterium]|nr:hypothetical protein [Actinomycetota bacterium]